MLALFDVDLLRRVLIPCFVADIEMLRWELQHFYILYPAS